MNALIPRVMRRACSQNRMILTSLVLNGSFTKAGKRPFCSSGISMVEMIAKKRDAKALTQEEIDYFVMGFNDGKLPEYQAAALLMAIYLNGMNDTETADLTLSMTNSGSLADLSSLGDTVRVDKHSTGGVGDKVSLPLAPLLASLGLADPMMSGRGLGHTGGTLDKLESIPGFQTSLTTEQFVEVLQKVGCAIIAPTEDVAPVDKVGSLPLICSSIMSKKIAENPQKLLLDVKFGSGAFMPTLDGGLELARSMIAAGENAGITTLSIHTSMDQPVGLRMGNWLEIEESVEVTLVESQCAVLLLLAGKVGSVGEGEALARRGLCDGSGFLKFAAMAAAQGGDADVLNVLAHDDGLRQRVQQTRAERGHEPVDWSALDAVLPGLAADAMPYHKRVQVETGGELRSFDVTAEEAGIITHIDCMEVGLTNVSMGAGRQQIEDEIDMQAGMVFEKKCGDAVQPGDTLLTLYATDANPGSGACEKMLEAAAKRVTGAFAVGSSAVDSPGLITHIASMGGVVTW